MVVGTTTRNRATQTRRRVAKPGPDQQPLIEKDQPERPTEVNGVKVLREVPIEHLPGKPFRISRLFLDDDTIAFACRDCLTVGQTRGDIMTHRNADHGAMMGRKLGPADPTQKSRAKKPHLRPAPDPIVPERADGTRPTSPMEMTLGEIMAIAPSLAALGDLVDKLESERDALAKELNERTKHDRSNQHKIDVYESLREEVVTLRLQVQKQGNYEQVKQEMYELRAWKKKIITKLNAVGFQLSEEDQ